MTLEKSDRFNSELESIIDYIAEESVGNALTFYDRLLEKIYAIPQNPYAYRKRPLLNDEYVRELIYKGYTIPFEIDNQENKIVILGIFNQNIWE